jgi:hypothetical protein
MIAIAFLLWAGTAAVGPEPCQALAEDLRSTLDRAKIAMEPQSAIGMVYQRATEAKDRCAADESLAYLRLRTAELGRGASVGRQSQSSVEELRTLTLALSISFPRSARIATVQARVSGVAADGRRATELDPSYAPAQVALAAALLATNPKEALAHLATVQNPGALSDGYTVLARVRLALGDLDGAAKAARAELKGRQLELIEPDGRDPRPISGAHEVLGLVALQRHDYRTAAMHLRAAAADSGRARAILDNPPSGLKAVMSRRDAKR